MDIVRRDGTDPAVIRACHDVATARDAADDPFGPPLTLRRLTGWLAHPVEPTELWVAEGATAGGIAGWYLLRLPDQENLDRGALDLAVHPASRRGGVGRALLRHAASGRPATGDRCCGEALQGTAGAAFAARVGATAGLVDARRVLSLGEIPAGRIARPARAGRPRGRRVLARVLAGPHARPVPGRVRRGAERGQRHAARPGAGGGGLGCRPGPRVRRAREMRGRHVYSVAALHDASGEMAAITDLEADQESRRGDTRC